MSRKRLVAKIRPPWHRARFMSLATFAALVLAAAPTPEECAFAAERAQPLRRSGRFTASLEQLRVCVADECPRVVREVCRALRAEVDAEVPTVAVTVQTQSGADVTRVQLRFDGKPVTAALGLPVELDPGIHTLEAAAPGHLTQRLELAVRAGEKLRPIVLTLEPEPTSPPAQRGRFPVWPGVATTVAAVMGLTAFIGFGSSARADVETLGRVCAPHCEPRLVDAARTKGLVADVSLLAAVVLAAVAIPLWALFGSR